MKIKEAEDRETPDLVEGEDYYTEDGLMVLTAGFLEKRGYCCRNGCRHCPYSQGASEEKFV